MTPRKYKEGVSHRLCVSKIYKERMSLPVLIVPADGVIGYFDECKTFVVKQSVIWQLQSLCMNFRVVMYGQGKKATNCLSQHLQDSKLVFDAVYSIRKGREDRANLTQILLDFYDEKWEFSKYCASNVIILSADKLKIE